jgi:molybdopterin-containing oxidoreductase family membrane subunit
MANVNKRIAFEPIQGRSQGYLGLLGLLLLFVLSGLGAAYQMEHNGHWISGMTNQVVWGTPHVFAVFLIVAASGALNIASIGSVFHKTLYKPLAPLSALLAISLLLGGLTVLVLDLGRPDRLIVAMTHYNFKSIFAWNIILYNGFLAIVAIYIWTMMDRPMNRFKDRVGFAAFIWRLILTTGTGSIFGFLVARQGYDAAIMAPMFIVMSFSFGLAIFLLVLMAAYSWSERPLGNTVLFRLKSLLGVFIAAVLFFVMIKHLTNLYATEHHGVEHFILVGGGIYTFLFWVVHVLIGSIAPLILIYHPQWGQSRTAIAAAASLVVVGGLAQMYVIIIGGQAYPLQLFPGQEVRSSFYDGVVAEYAPSLYEIMLGLLGIALAMLIVTTAIKILKFLPTSLEDAVTDPHYRPDKA